MSTLYDVIVVGAGPGGSSAATFLARQGITTLLLDKSSFPRDKVCGDGLTPQAVYWLDRLGCADEVLAADQRLHQVRRHLHQQRACADRRVSRRHDLSRLRHPARPPALRQHPA